jgi:RND family efflux transporter MFP subunit
VAALAQRRAEYEIAKKQLADASVRAPFDGIVQARPAGLGEHIVAGTPVVMLVKVDPLRLRLEVPERDSALVRTGQVVRLAVAGDTNVYAGVMARLSPALDYQSRMLVVEADVPSRGALRPGLFVRAEIIVNGREEGLSVPRDAIVTFAGLEKVIAVEAGKAVEKVVNTGRAGPDWIEVISGIKAGEVVVIEPGSLRTGQSVTGGQEPLTMKATSVSTAQKLAD